MNALPEPDAFLDPDFETLEAAVMATVRGRWFLAEYARRNRASETERLLNALHRIERAMSQRVTRPVFDVSQLEAASRELAAKLDDILRHLQHADTAKGDAPADPDEQRLIEARLIEPRPFMVRRG